MPGMNGSATGSGAIFLPPAAFGHTHPELSEAALADLLVPFVAVAAGSIGHRSAGVKTRLYPHATGPRPPDAPRLLQIS